MAIRRTTAATAAACGLLVAMVAVATPTAGALPVLVNSTCTADAPMTPRGTVTVQVPFLGPVPVPFAALGQPLADALESTDLPLPLPVDLDATAAIEPGGTIDYATSVAVDPGTALQDVVDVARQGLAAAGFQQLADTLQLGATFDQLTVPFPHPDGTTATGTPTATGATGVSASHTATSLEVVIPRFAISTAAGIDALELQVGWSVVDAGTPPPATLAQDVGDIRFTLDVEVSGTLPAELVNLLLADTLPFPVTGDLPVMAGARGPWSCTASPPATVATTSVLLVDGIAGHVFDSDGAPVAGAEVYVARPGEPDSVRSVEVGPDGDYRVLGLPAGGYAVYATAPGAEPVCYPSVRSCAPGVYEVLQLSEGGALVGIDLTLEEEQGGAVAGTLTDDAEVGISHAQVWVVGRGFRSFRLAHTTPDGQWRVGGLDDGVYFVWFNVVGGPAGCYPGPICGSLTVADGSDLDGLDLALGS